MRRTGPISASNPSCRLHLRADGGICRVPAGVAGRPILRMVTVGRTGPVRIMGIELLRPGGAKVTVRKRRIGGS